jgi:hypothetical protein
MNAQLTKQLYDAFPSLYREASLSHQQTCMCWGFLCDDGWYQLVYNLSSAISEYANSMGLDPVAVQVKEKFGGLRYYIRNGDDQIMRWIDEAEELSMSICECCGKSGELRTERPYIRTLCNACFNNQE